MTLEQHADGSLKVSGVSHSYGREMALEGVDLDVRDGEFVTFLGPSGCGKTTLLRIIAGFIDPTAGSVSIGGRDLSGVSAHRRPVNMVFQRPTLFPHLDVFENVAFGLRIDRTDKDEVSARVSEALALVRLDGYERRRASELSGGQMQRVALARALVKRPRVLLLDEPLSALDLKIRLEMEGELRRVHRETGATWIYVTHDQREALALSDRVAVFDHGHIDQLATPIEIYRRPATPFAARFVGDANVIACEVVNGSSAPVARLEGADVPLHDTGLQTGPAWLVVRPEHVRIAPSAGDGANVPAVVRDVAFRGTAFSYRLDVPGLAEPLKAEVAATPEHPYEVGAAVAIGWMPNAGIVLPRRP
jgi:ABC-type Fe3+/spermidine/putrescine transport system ATPase subunit